jgi:hypothetical protein
VESKPPLFGLNKAQPGPLILCLRSSRFASELRTSGLFQPFFDRLQLDLKLLILDCKPTVRVLEQGLEVLDPLVPCQ